MISLLSSSLVRHVTRKCEKKTLPISPRSSRIFLMFTNYFHCHFSRSRNYSQFVKLLCSWAGKSSGDSWQVRLKDQPILRGREPRGWLVTWAGGRRVLVVIWKLMWQLSWIVEFWAKVILNPWTFLLLNNPKVAVHHKNVTWHLPFSLHAASEFEKLVKFKDEINVVAVHVDNYLNVHNHLFSCLYTVTEWIEDIERCARKPQQNM